MVQEALAGQMGGPEAVAAATVFPASPVSHVTMVTNPVLDGALTRGVQF